MLTMWLIKHDMCPPLVGGCVGLTKTDVLLNTMLVRYQQWYWSCIDNGVNTLYSLDIYRSHSTHICTHLHQNQSPLKQDDVWLATMSPRCMCSRCHGKYSTHTLGDDGLLDGHFPGDVHVNTCYSSISAIVYLSNLQYMYIVYSCVCIYLRVCACVHAYVCEHLFVV